MSAPVKQIEDLYKIVYVGREFKEGYFYFTIKAQYARSPTEEEFEKSVLPTFEEAREFINDKFC